MDGLWLAGSGSLKDNTFQKMRAELGMENWHLLQHEKTLKTLHWMREASHRPHTLWFYLYENSKKGSHCFRTENWTQGYSITELHPSPITDLFIYCFETVFLNFPCWLWTCEPQPQVAGITRMRHHAQPKMEINKNRK